MKAIFLALQEENKFVKWISKVGLKAQRMISQLWHYLHLRLELLVLLEVLCVLWNIYQYPRTSPARFQSHLSFIVTMTNVFRYYHISPDRQNWSWWTTTDLEQCYFSSGLFISLFSLLQLVFINHQLGLSLGLRWRGRNEQGTGYADFSPEVLHFEIN